jgi:hypothetical protein
MRIADMSSIIPLFAFACAASAPSLSAEPIAGSHFRGVELRGGGNVVVVPGPVQRVTLVEGSTRFTRFRVLPDGRLRIDTCNQSCPQLYRMRVEIQSPEVPDLGVSGGGSITARSGFRPQSDLAAAVNGGGQIDARAVEARNVSAAVNGGGDIAVRARSALSAAINGGGLVRYAGNPQVSSAVRGGGAVRALN